MNKDSLAWALRTSMDIVRGVISVKRNDITHEGRAASRFVLDGISAATFVSAYLPPGSPNAIIFKGFGAPDIMYKPLRRFLEYGLGIRTHMPRFDWLDKNHYLRSHDMLREFCGYVNEQFGEIQFGIGHSLGATEAVSCADLFTRKVVAIAGVFNGGIQWPLVEGAEPHIWLPESMQRKTLLETMRKVRQCSPEKIVTIIAEGDRLIPVEHAILPNAKNYVYWLADDASYRNSHVYLPNTVFAKNVLKSELSL